MAFKNCFKILFFGIALFVIGFIPLFAQTSGYYMVLRFVQRLTWVADEYAMRYEVIIEKEENGKYRRFSQEFTKANFIEVSLLPGKYRYQVIPYDYLDQSIPVAAWTNFEVLRGDEKLTTGEHEIIIVNPEDESTRKAIILISPETAETTELTETLEPIIITEIEKTTEYKNAFDIYAGAAWMPLLPFYGNSSFLGEDNSLVGAGMRLTIISAKKGFVSPGVELAASWRAFGNYFDNDTIHSLTFDFNIVAQTRFPGERTALNLRWCVGTSMLPELDPISSTGKYSLHANVGASLLCLVTKSLYLEAGTDYSQFFTRDYFGFLRPWVGLGYRF